MKANSTSRSAFFNPRPLLGLVLCFTGLFLAVVGSSKSFAQIASTTLPGLPDSRSAESPAQGTHASANLTYKVITAPQATWGYDVFADGRLMIHQSSVPALPGNEGFRTKEDATKVALLVIEKIRKGETPPTISIDEMKTLSVIK